MAELPERSRELVLPQLVGPHTQRPDDGDGKASTPIAGEPRGHPLAFALSSADRRRRRRRPIAQVVGGPIHETRQRAGVRADAPGDREIDDEERPAAHRPADAAELTEYLHLASDQRFEPGRDAEEVARSLRSAQQTRPTRSRQGRLVDRVELDAMTGSEDERTRKR